MTALLSLVLALPLLHGPAPTPAAPANGSSVEISATGDVNLGHAGVYPAGGPQSLLGRVKGLLAAPISFGNLETALADTGGSAPASKCSASSTSCYAFDAPESFADGLRRVGFTVLNLANNHSNDEGSEGRVRTVDALSRAGLRSTGAPGQITVMRTDGIRVALLGFAPYTTSADLLDLPRAKQLVKAAARRADVVIVAMHVGAEGADRTHVPFGDEFYLGEDRGDARAFSHAVVDAGADLVLGSGPHVLRGMQWYRRRLIAYSLGNFSGYDTLSLDGVLADSVVLRVKLDRRGGFVNGRLIPIRIDAPGSPVVDGTRTSIKLVRQLSREDFGRSAADVDDSGRIKRP